MVGSWSINSLNNYIYFNLKTMKSSQRLAVMAAIAATASLTNTESILEDKETLGINFENYHRTNHTDNAIFTPRVHTVSNYASHKRDKAKNKTNRLLKSRRKNKRK